MANPEIESSVQWLTDIETIKRLRAKFCQYVDYVNHDDWLSLFTEDATLITGAFPLERDPYEGHDELAQLLVDIEEQDRQLMKHNAFNPTIEIDGDSASGLWNTLVIIILNDGTISWLQGHYDEEYQRVDGDWKFASIDIIVQYRMEFRDETWSRIAP